MAILTVTLNPALDLETQTDQIQPSEKLRCSNPLRDPGGGGINVARAVTQLGGMATALVAAGGAGGGLLQEMLAGKGVAMEPLPAPGELRQNLSVIEASSGKQFRFIFPGPTWSAADLDRILDHLAARVAPGDWVVVSGSLPPGLAPEALGRLTACLSRAGAKTVLDTSGEALLWVSRTSGLGLTLLRMDHEESELIAGQRLETAAESAEVAAGLVAQGVAEIVIVARGAKGSVLASKNGAWSAPAAKVPVVSRTGAGDSFVAGAVLSLSRGAALPDVLERGCASASAAVTTAATDLCDLQTMQQLLPQSRSTRL